MNNDTKINPAKKRVVIKLSGSIFCHNAKKNTIKEYAEMLFHIGNDVQPIVITGGGKIARQYIELGRKFGLDEASLDMMGIDVSRLNAKLLIAALGGNSYSRVPTNLEEVEIAAESGKIVIAGGLHPGQSTNATSALIAEKIKASTFLNATDVSGIYNSDPNTTKNAKLFKEITVKKCIEILGAGSSMAGTYDLIDIVALKVIERSNIHTRILLSDVSNIKNAIEGKHCIGTEIIVVKKRS
ncbi:MAG TPA: UMP kinase [Nitrososphaeraceae archaeon]